MAKPASKEMKYITRVGNGHLVRVYKKGRTVAVKFFGDKAHEGKAKARAAAKVFRDQACERHGIDLTADAVHWGKRGYYFTADAKGNRVCIAFWTEDGKQRKRSFSVRKYGYHKARAMAKAHRKAMTAKKKGDQ